MDGNCTRVCKGFLSAPTNDTYVRLCIMLSRFIEIEGSLKAIYLNYTAKFNCQPFMYVAKGNQMKSFLMKNMLCSQ